MGGDGLRTEASGNERGARENSDLEGDLCGGGGSEADDFADTLPVEETANKLFDVVSANAGLPSDVDGKDCEDVNARDGGGET